MTVFEGKIQDKLVFWYKANLQFLLFWVHYILLQTKAISMSSLQKVWSVAMNL